MAAPTFSPGNVDGNIAGLLTSLRAGFKSRDDNPPNDSNCPEHAFVSAFVDYYMVDANFTTPEKFANNDIVTNVVQQLVINKPPLLYKLLKLLLIFSRNEANQAQIVKVDGIPVIVGCMRRLASDLEVQEHACRLVINLATNDKNRKQFAKEGGIDLVLDCLRNGAGTPNLLMAASWAVSNLTALDANMKLAAQRGAGGLLIRTMEANMTDTGIQEHCVWSLQHLTMRDDLREALAKAGAVTRVIDALKGFPGEKRVQQGGAWAINNFSANAKCRDYVKKENGVEIMLATSTRFPDDTLIQRMTSEAIVNLSQLGSEDSDDPKKAGSTGLNEVVVPIRKAFLTKQGGGIKTWHKRWFVLDSQKISYYKGQEEKEALGVINLTSVDGVMEDSGKPFGFLVVTAARTYRIFGTSKPEQQEWMAAIKAAKTDFIKRRQEAAKRAEESIPEDMRMPHDEVEGFLLDWVLQELNDG